MIAIWKNLGFGSKRQAMRLISATDISTPEKLARFKRWQAMDGTAAGLRRLSAPRRLPNWPTLLARFIEERRHTPFAWGQQDCCLFACDGILTITGVDPAAGIYRGKYHDKLGAARLVRKHGGVEAIAAKVCARYEWPELATPLLAQRGDVVLIPRPDDPMQAMLAVCVGAECALPGADGLLFQPLSAAARAWAVARHRT